jgi:hypothetical protein
MMMMMMTLVRTGRFTKLATGKANWILNKRERIGARSLKRRDKIAENKIK